MTELVNIGYGNVVNFHKVIAIINPDSSPAKRMVQKAKELEQIIDATQGRKTKAVLVMESGQIVLSALQPETLAGRARGELNRKEGLIDE